MLVVNVQVFETPSPLPAAMCLLIAHPSSVRNFQKFTLPVNPFFSSQINSTKKPSIMI